MMIIMIKIIIIIIIIKVVVLFYGVFVCVFVIIIIIIIIIGIIIIITRRKELFCSAESFGAGAMLSCYMTPCQPLTAQTDDLYPIVRVRGRELVLRPRLLACFLRDTQSRCISSMWYCGTNVSVTHLHFNIY